jgi:phage terminase small subunit
MAQKKEIELITGEIITLSERELLFADTYLADAKRNGANAAIMVGYSPRTAKVTASQLLTKPNLLKYIESKTKPMLEALGVTQERLIRERASMAFTNITDLVDDDWRLKKPSEIDPKHYPALNSVEIEEKVLIKDEDDKEGIVISRKIKYKLADKDKSLTVLEDLTGLIKKSEDKSGEGGSVVNNITINQQINNQYNSR